ncbi:MAG: hypothetical protein M0017_04175 [Desulfobacteraceae bacterium]|nr:hypothetical protein [Desulfobacteraceae bacterium]
MASTDELQPQGEKMRRTVLWISETLRVHPEKDRQAIIREAQIRFDLSPLEAKFISDKLGKGLPLEE